MLFLAAVVVMALVGVALVVVTIVVVNMVVVALVLAIMTTTASIIGMALAPLDLFFREITASYLKKGLNQQTSKINFVFKKIFPVIDDV